MTNFERLLPYLHRVLQEGRLNLEAEVDLRAFRHEAEYRALPRTIDEALVHGDHALFLLRVTTDALVCLADEDEAAALGVLQQAQGLPLSPDPLKGAPYLLAARLAERLEQQDVQTFFQERYAQYLHQFAAAHALLGLSDLLVDPQLEGHLKDALAVGAPAEQDNSDFGPSYLPFTSVDSAFASLSTSEQATTRTYFVLARKLTDARVAAFAIFNATLADITDGGDYGREDEQGGFFADLVLAFEGDASELLSSLDPEDLAIRFVFHHSEAFETFTAEDGSLFDAEVSLEEGRVYFKLRVPPAWLAAHVPLHAVWANLESCVLLSGSE